MNDLPSEFMRTDFGHEVYDGWYLEHAGHNFEAPEFIKKHIPFYEQALQLSKNDKILEAGCGIGSYSREFVRRGYPVVGMDMSPNFLAEAKRITQLENLEIEYVLGDYNEMRFEEAFSVIFFEGSFFYNSRERLVLLLKRIYKALTPNGRLYFVHSNPSMRKKRSPMEDRSELEKNVFVLQKTEWDEDNEGERCTWLKIDLGTQKHYRCDFFNQHLRPNEIKNCLAGTGFTDVHFYKKRRLEDFHPKDDGFSVVAKK
ncbi:MAG: class I SAM-dependent methyltransferase [Candidatus Poribacteria bacterium]|nr:class I SAM-dependent methyltransferase [Candidatus Poribacteria bacterium]